MIYKLFDLIAVLIIIVSSIAIIALLIWLPYWLWTFWPALAYSVVGVISFIWAIRRVEKRGL